MLERLKKLSSSILNLIIYVDSSSLDYYIKNTLKQHYNVHKGFVVTADTVKELKGAKLDSCVAPLYGGKWLVHVNCDKVDKKEVMTALNTPSVNAITVFWTSKYKIYKDLIGLDMVKRQGSYCNTFYFGKLSPGDIKYLYKDIVGDDVDNGLDKSLLNTLAFSYGYDVQSVCDVIYGVKSGKVFKNKKDLIEVAGIGGNSIDSFVVSLLTLGCKTEKEKKSSMSKTLKLLDDLTVDYDHRSIKNIMLSVINGFIDMKQLQIMGYYKSILQTIPECYDTKRLARLKRYERVIFNQSKPRWGEAVPVTLPKLLNLKMCIQQFDNLDAELALLQGIYAYYNTIETVEEVEVDK